MKFYVHFSLMIAVCSLGTGCPDGGYGDELQAAIDASHAAALQKGISDKEYFLSSMRLLRDKRNSNFDEADAKKLNDNFELQMLDALKNKEYWESCYSLKSDNYVGGGICFYIESDSDKLLFVHKGA